jgi:hypothetical protein
MVTVARADPALLAAATAFAGACALGGAVAMREGIPGEPLGIRLPISVRTGVLVGWGAGVAAPWPMPAAALIAAVSSGRRSAVPGYLCAALGAACIVGTLIEPVSRRPRTWTPATRVAIATNLASSIALVAAGLHHAKQSRSNRPQRTKMP